MKKQIIKKIMITKIENKDLQKIFFKISGIIKIIFEWLDYYWYPDIVRDIKNLGIFVGVLFLLMFYFFVFLGFFRFFLNL